MNTVEFPRMHISFYVSDINKTIDFYNKFFGQEPEKTKPDYAKYLLAKPALIISFVENKERVQSQFGHVGFQVETPGALLDKMLLVQKLGLKTKEEMGTSCCYAYQDKFWVIDPDGIHWEVYYFHEDAEFNDPRFETGSQEACCVPGESKKKKVSLGSLGQTHKELV